MRTMIGFLACLLLCTNTVHSQFSPKFELKAEFVTVDYLWDASHTQAAYSGSGQFQVPNNVITGIKVSAAGDIFVTVPRWKPGVPSSLNKLVPNPNRAGYVLAPWPSWESNAIGKAGSIQYAQSMVIDKMNRMWIPDVGRLNIYTPAPVNGPSVLYVKDVTSGAALFSYTFPNEVVPYNNSFVNDLVLDENNYNWVYLANTAANGGIIVYNVQLNTSRMFVSQYTEREANVDVVINGYNYGNHGVAAAPSDGIALSDDGATLYWAPVQGATLYSIDTASLQNFTMTDAEFASRTGQYVSSVSTL
jgi:hypothetical protein